MPALFVEQLPPFPPETPFTSIVQGAEQQYTAARATQGLIRLRNNCCCNSSVAPAIAVKASGKRPSARRSCRKPRDVAAAPTAGAGRDGGLSQLFPNTDVSTEAADLGCCQCPPGKQSSVCRSNSKDWSWHVLQLPCARAHAWQALLAPVILCCYL